MTRVWMDIKSPSDAHVIAAFYRHLKDFDFTITARDRAEAIAIARGYNLPFTAVGKDDPGRVRKVFNYAWRIPQLSGTIGKFDASLSFNNMNAILLARLRGKTSITLMDNDHEFVAGTWSLAKKLEMKNNLRATRIIVPEVFPLDLMVDLGAKPEAITTFDGFKEDLYTADFVPDPTFPATLPFDDYVVVRPEALSAVYVRKAASIVPDLLRALTAAGQNVVYLPRVPADKQHLPADSRNIIIPKTPPNGLQLIWHSKAVLTGSGSFAREAACLGVTSASFFPDTLLAVDRKMIAEGRVLHSREVDRIVPYVIKERRSVPSTERSRKVRDSIMDTIQVHLVRGTRG